MAENKIEEQDILNLAAQFGNTWSLNFYTYATTGKSMTSA